MPNSDPPTRSVVSMVPAGTEIVAALGWADMLADGSVAARVGA